MSEIRQGHLDSANLSKADGTAWATISYSKPSLVHLQPPGVLTSDSFVIPTAAGRQLQATPEHYRSNYRRLAWRPYCSCTTTRFNHILWGTEIKTDGKMLCLYLSCLSLLHPMQSHISSTPILFPLSFPTTPPLYHYLVGFCKEGSFLKELFLVFQNLLTPSLFLSNPQQVSVLVAQALGRREKKDD